MQFLTRFYRNGAIWLANRIWKPRYIGLEKIPAQGAAILICNHVSYVDGLLLYAGSPRPIRFLMDGEIYNLPFVHHFMKLARAIPIMPNRESVTKAFDEISEALKAGELVCIFPEGQLTYTGGLSRFRPGIEWVLKRDPVPVVPMAITGLWGSVFSRKFLGTRFRWWPRHRKLDVRILCGDPIPAGVINVNFLQRIVMRLKQEAMLH